MANHVTQGAIGGLTQTLVGICHAEQVLLRIDDTILHVHLDPYHVLVLSQHKAGRRQGAHGLNVHRDHLIDESRLPAQARLDDMGKLAKAQHCTTLGFTNGIEAANDPYHHGDNQRDGDTKAAYIAARFATAKQAAKATTHLAQHLVQIRGPLILAVIPPGVTVFAVVTRLIPSHQRLH